MIVSTPGRHCMKWGTGGGYHTLLPPSMTMLFPVAGRPQRIFEQSKRPVRQVQFSRISYLLRAAA